MTLIQLEEAVLRVRSELEFAEKALATFKATPEHNSYDSLDGALGHMEDSLLERAREDCEGSHNCGADQYTQEFIVNGKHYIATLDVEYNRHDKTYYYVDAHSFSYKGK